MRLAGAMILSIALAGCATGPKLACPAGQAELRTAQLFLGSKPAVNDSELRRFVETEVTPRFPDGVTVVKGGGQWKGDDNRLIREAAKVVLIVLPAKGDAHRRLEAVRTAYRVKYSQTPPLVLPPPSCVAL